MTVAGSLDCGSCRQPFDLGPRRPKVLPCGHTCCRGCLLDRETGVRCPEDNKVFAGSADGLTDNLYLNSTIDRSLHRQRNAGRLLVSLDRAALRHQHELAALQEFRSQCLAALRGSVDAVLRDQLRVLQCLARLRLSSGTEAWQRQRKEAHRLLETEEPQRHGLRQDLRLLRGRRLAARPALELRGAGSLSAAAEAELQLEEQPALRLAATRLREQGDLPHVEYQEEETYLGRNYMKSMSLTDETCEYWKKDKTLLLETSTKFTRWSSRLYCDRDPAWALALMRRHSATLTYVRLDCARLEHVAALWEFPELEELEVSLYGYMAKETVDYAGLPLQWPPPGPSKARRLWRIMHLEMPWSFAKVLLSAHRDSLLEVSVWRGEGEHTWAEVAELLRECDLYRVRKFYLGTPELTEEEADLLRSALPNTCQLDYYKKVDVPKEVQVPQITRVTPWSPPVDVDEEDDGLDLGLGLFD